MLACKVLALILLVLASEIVSADEDLAYAANSVKAALYAQPAVLYAAPQRLSTAGAPVPYTVQAPTWTGGNGSYTQSQSSQPMVRLVGGQKKGQGRLEMLDGLGRWAPVCAGGITYKETAVVCKSLGYNPPAVTTPAWTSSQTQPNWYQASQQSTKPQQAYPQQQQQPGNYQKQTGYPQPQTGYPQQQNPTGYQKTTGYPPKNQTSYSQQQYPSGYSQQQQYPTGNPPQQQYPSGYPQQQQQQYPSGYPQQQQQYPTGYQQQQQYPTGYQQQQQQYPTGYTPQQQYPTGYTPQQQQQYPTGYQKATGYPSQQQPSTYQKSTGSQYQTQPSFYQKQVGSTNQQQSYNGQGQNYNSGTKNYNNQGQGYNSGNPGNKNYNGQGQGYTSGDSGNKNYNGQGQGYTSGDSDNKNYNGQGQGYTSGDSGNKNYNGQGQGYTSGDSGNKNYNGQGQVYNSGNQDYSDKYSNGASQSTYPHNTQYGSSDSDYLVNNGNGKKQYGGDDDQQQQGQYTGAYSRVQPGSESYQPHSDDSGDSDDSYQPPGNQGAGYGMIRSLAASPSASTSSSSVQSSYAKAPGIYKLAGNASTTKDLPSAMKQAPGSVNWIISPAAANNNYMGMAWTGSMNAPNGIPTGGYQVRNPVFNPIPVKRARRQASDGSTTTTTTTSTQAPTSTSKASSFFASTDRPTPSIPPTTSTTTSTTSTTTQPATTTPAPTRAPAAPAKAQPSISDPFSSVRVAAEAQSTSAPPKQVDNSNDIASLISKGSQPAVSVVPVPNPNVAQTKPGALQFHSLYDTVQYTAPAAQPYADNDTAYDTYNNTAYDTYNSTAYDTYNNTAYNETYPNNTQYESYESYEVPAATPYYYEAPQETYEYVPAETYDTYSPPATNPGSYVIQIDTHPYGGYDNDEYYNNTNTNYTDTDEYYNNTNTNYTDTDEYYNNTSTNYTDVLYNGFPPANFTGYYNTNETYSGLPTGPVSNYYPVYVSAPYNDSYTNYYSPPTYNLTVYNNTYYNPGNYYTPSPANNTNYTYYPPSPTPSKSNYYPAPAPAPKYIISGSSQASYGFPIKSQGNDGYKYMTGTWTPESPSSPSWNDGSDSSSPGWSDDSDSSPTWTGDADDSPNWQDGSDNTPNWNGDSDSSPNWQDQSSSPSWQDQSSSPNWQDQSSSPSWQDQSSSPTWNIAPSNLESDFGISGLQCNGNEACPSQCSFDYVTPKCIASEQAYITCSVPGEAVTPVWSGASSQAPTGSSTSTKGPAWTSSTSGSGSTATWMGPATASVSTAPAWRGSSLPTVCPPGWIDGDGIGCFYIPSPNDKENRRWNWFEAERYCSDLGGFLTQITNKKQLKFLTTIIDMMEVTSSIPSDFWIGITDSGREGVWVYPFSGQPVRFGVWARDSPVLSEYNHNDCGLLSRKDDYRMRDSDCFSRANDKVDLILPICEIYTQDKAGLVPPKTYFKN